MSSKAEQGEHSVARRCDLSPSGKQRLIGSRLPITCHTFLNLISKSIISLRFPMVGDIGYSDILDIPDFRVYFLYGPNWRGCQYDDCDILDLQRSIRCPTEFWRNARRFFRGKNRCPVHVRFPIDLWRSVRVPSGSNSNPVVNQSINQSALLLCLLSNLMVF